MVEGKGEGAKIIDLDLRRNRSRGNPESWRLTPIQNGMREHSGVFAENLLGIIAVIRVGDLLEGQFDKPYKAALSHNSKEALQGENELHVWLPWRMRGNDESLFSPVTVRRLVHSARAGERSRNLFSEDISFPKDSFDVDPLVEETPLRGRWAILNSAPLPNSLGKTEQEHNDILRWQERILRVPQKSLRVARAGEVAWTLLAQYAQHGEHLLADTSALVDTSSNRFGSSRAVMGFGSRGITLEPVDRGFSREDVGVLYVR